MSTTIREQMGRYYVVNPWNKRTETFNSVLQAIDYCRMSGLVYSLAF